MSLRSSRSGAKQPVPWTVAVRDARICIEMGFPREKCCSGCLLFESAALLNVEDGATPSMKTAIDDRFTAKTYRSKPFRCHQYWKNSDRNLPARMKALAGWQKSFIRTATSSRGTSPESLLVTPAPLADTPVATAEPQPEPELENAELEPREIQYSEPKPKRQKTRDEINMVSFEFSSAGHDFSLQVPRTHSVVHNSRLGPMAQSQQTLNELVAGCNRQRYSQSSEYVKTLLVTALAAAPSIPFSTLSTVLPLLVGSMLANLGLLERTDIGNFCRSFPSEAYMRNLMFSKAAECTLSLSCKLKEKLVFLACDKGNKKGMDHLVKYVSYWNQDSRQVTRYLLDIDASEGKSEDCAFAMEESLKKVGCYGKDGNGAVLPSSFYLQGSTTDSGGGGTLDSFAKCLISRGLCHQPLFLVVGCSIHSLQRQLAVPVEHFMGTGGIGKRDLLQTLHSFYDVQESCEWIEFKAYIKAAEEWVEAAFAKGGFKDSTDHFEKSFVTSTEALTKDTGLWWWTRMARRRSP